MRGLLLVAVLTVAGCLQSDAPDGLLFCSGIAGRECPMGYYCEATSDSCWHDGHFPDMSLAGEDLSSTIVYPHYDLTIPLVFDMSMPDLSTPDLSPPTD